MKKRLARIAHVGSKVHIRERGIFALAYRKALASYGGLKESRTIFTLKELDGFA
ncbi:MAG: hypothetical protein AB7C97_05685 [Oscillospiraceae bacterium]